LINNKNYTDLIGTVLNERYKLTDLCGIGGMAVVFRAEDLQTGKEVAIKILNDDNSSDEKAVRRFVNESKAVAMLSHENIVNIYDVTFDDPLKYIVMELVEGVTLKDYLEKKGKLPVDEALSYTAQILSGLEHAHGMGIIHRDMKPQNILLLPDGSIKITDFGIAKLPTADTITMSDKAMGTVHYISPEQASGEPTDARTDIYSVGVMLYEMVTGKLPFNGDTPLAVAMMQVNNEPTDPSKYAPELPKGVVQIILKAMRKDPDDRFRSAKSMLRAVTIVKSSPDVVFEEKKKNRAVEKVDETKPEEKKTGAVGFVREKNDKAKETAPKKPIKIKKAKRTMFPIIFGVCAAFLIVLLVSALIVGMSFLKNQTKDLSITVTIPQLVGEKFTQDLSSSLSSGNIRVAGTEYRFSSDYPENTIISQTPAAGTRRKLANDTLFCDVTLVISQGKQKVTMPDVTVTEYRTARIKLTNLGLNVQIVKKYDDAILDGYVISASVPAGTEISSGDTVTIYVSEGQQIKYAKMVNVLGMDYSDAKRTIENAGFVVGRITREPSDFPTNAVVSQSVEQDQLCPMKYTIVDLVLSIQYTDEVKQQMEEERLRLEEEERLRLEEEERLKQEQEQNGQSEAENGGSGENTENTENTENGESSGSGENGENSGNGGESQGNDA